MVDLYNQTNADCVFTVVKSKSKLGRIVDGRFVPINYKFEQRSQDLIDYYEEKGILYLIRVTSVLREGTLFGKVNIPYIITEKYPNLDIDTALELDIDTALELDIDTALELDIDTALELDIAKLIIRKYTDN